MDIKGCCRLCFNLKENMLNIYELNISNILSRHFWFMVLETDEFSKTICEECWQCVDKFNRFYNEVKNTYDKYIEDKFDTRIVKTEELTTSDDSNCNADDIVTIIHSPSFIPYELMDLSNHAVKYERKEDKTISTIKRKSTNKSKVYKKRLKHQESNEITESNLEDEVNKVIPDDAVKSEIPLKCELDSDEIGNEIQGNTNEDIDLHMNCKNILKNTEIVKKCKKRKLKTVQNSGVVRENEVHSIEMDKKIRQYCNMQCELCDYKFDTFLIAKQHYRNSHNINGYLRCCTSKLSRRGRVLEHIERHINPNAFRCDICNKSYVDKTSIKRHLESHLPEALRPYKCAECPRAFVTDCKLLQHRRVRHVRKEDKKFHCKQCDKSFVKKSFLSTHIRSVHDCVYAQICDICAKICKTKQALKDHLLQHVGDDPVKLQCNRCGVWLKHKNSLRLHMYNHQDTPQRCSICNKVSPTKQALRSHMRYFHSERIHECTLCDRKFKKPIELQEHIATHTGENLYTCTYCPRTFKSIANMYSHRKKNHPVEWQHDRGMQTNSS